MSCNCHKLKALGTIEHIRILATQFATIENQKMVIYKCGSAFAFCPLLGNYQEIFEVVEPIKADNAIPKKTITKNHK